MLKRNYASTLVLFAGVIAIVLGACSSQNPREVRLVFNDMEIAPDLVDRTPGWAFTVESDEQGRAYIHTWLSEDSRPTVRRIYRRSLDSSWEIVFESEIHSTESFEMRIRPGSSEIFIGKCLDRPVDQGGIEKHFQLYRVEGSDSIDISDDSWGDIPAETLSAIGISDCRANWAVDGGGALILSTENSIWRVKDGQVEMLLPDIAAVMRVPAYFDDYCARQSPELRVNASGAILIYYSDAPCGFTDGPGPDAVLIAASEVIPLLTLGRVQSIKDASIGPNGAVHFLLRESASDNSLGSIYTGVRATGSGSDEFLTFKAKIDTSLHAMSVSDSGRIFMIYDHGGEFSSPKFWLLGFPTEDQQND